MHFLSSDFSPVVVLRTRRRYIGCCMPIKPQANYGRAGWEGSESYNEGTNTHTRSTSSENAQSLRRANLTAIIIFSGVEIVHIPRDALPLRSELPLLLLLMMPPPPPPPPPGSAAGQRSPPVTSPPRRRRRGHVPKAGGTGGTRGRQREIRGRRLRRRVCNITT